MAAGGDIRFYVGFTGDIEDEVAWVDLTDDVIDCSLNYGRQNPADQWGANQSHVLLSDRTRKYDPLNTSGTYSPNIKPGILARIEVLDGNDDIIRQFRGVIRKWEPAYWAGDEAGTVLVTIGDYLSVLNQPMPRFTEDWFGSKLGSAPGCAYVFTTDYVNTTTGVVTDVSGQGRHGYTFSDYVTPTAGAVLKGTGNAQALDLDGTPNKGVFRLGVEGIDPIAEGAGMFFYVESWLASSPAITTGGYDYWYLASSGRNAVATNTWELWLKRDTTTGAIDLDLYVSVYGLTAETYSMPIIASGTATTYVTSQRRVWGFGIAGDVVTLFAVVPIHGTGDLNASAAQIVLDTFTYGFPGMQNPILADDGWDTWLGRRQASASDSTTFDVYRTGVVHASADEAFCTGFAETYRDRGSMDLEADDRVTAILDQIAHPATFESIELDTSYALDPASLLGFTTVLQFFQTLTTMGRGRLFDRPNAVSFRLEDEDATSTSSGATWSDQGTSPGWRAGTAVVNTAYDDSINDVSVALTNGYAARAVNQTSIDAIGIRARVYSLPFAVASEADTFAADLVSRFNDTEISVSFLVEPVNGIDYWQNLEDADEIGDTVVWQHQALATGPVITTTMEIGGEAWAWDQHTQRWSVRLYLEPNRT